MLCVASATDSVLADPRICWHKAGVVADGKKQVDGGDETRQLSRRKLLERLALGGAAISVTLLPSEWVKPVVETIVVPAHGQVSGPSPSAPGTVAVVFDDAGPFADPDTSDLGGRARRTPPPSPSRRHAPRADMDTIFVQIASYRDPQLLPTLRDCIAKATRPDLLRFGVCWQRDESEA